ncbi:unnamed protein product [Hermetia illucens]|uniref:Uncharacterized protein n=2 Tax=Hermetia illucens TaxID=343691 RepID=A0A7R8V2F7_HERIL|nr:unnamed protein product [Hermetia illucens]
MGADLVYSEELIDWKLMKAKRRENLALGTIDFVDPSDGSIVFRTCKHEEGRVILQLGTAEAERALAVGKLVESDVAGIDINMGCPKEFSIKGGMGAALLAKPEKARGILKTLVENLRIPVTCKIRLLPDVEETVKLVKSFESAGISAIAIHARTRDERPHHDPHPEVVKRVAAAVRIPVIANGGSREIDKYADIAKFRDACGVDSVMIARAAQYNVSIFRKEGLLPLDDVIVKYLKLCIDYDNPPSNTKYCVQNMLREQQESPRGRRFLNCQTLESMCEIWALGEYCHQKQLEFQEKGNFGRRDVVPGNLTEENDETPTPKKAKVDSEAIFERNIAFFRANYTDDKELPKTKLHVYAGKHDKLLPTYETQREDKLFRTILTFDGKKYASLYWEKNKKFAEQGAALVCLLGLGVVSEESLIQNGSILK